MATVTPASSPTASPPVKKPQWSPHIWEGLDFFAWLDLLARNSFAVHWTKWYIAVIVTFVSFFHTLLRIVQEAIWGRRIRKAMLTEPPIFVLGHWRTGTTLLHEFLILDERHGFPTTYECIDPNHFLLTEKLFTKLFSFLIPAQRPMHNMKFGFDRPQEDEFALCMMGVPSPYLTIAFPNHLPQCQNYLDLKNLPKAALRRWQQAFLRFLKMVTLKQKKRLVLKSPPHTARLEVLREMFPNALFVHIVRNPYVVFPSTVNLWKTLFLAHGLQKPRFDGLEEHVLTTFTQIYKRLEEGKKHLQPSQFLELRYEDLISDPAAEMRRLYEHFQLGGFENYLPRLEKYLESVKDYERNRYEMTPEQSEAVTRRWGDVIERYGYAKRP